MLNDIKKLEAKFNYGFWPDALVFYVSICSEKGEEQSVKNENASNWDLYWTSINKEFEAKLALNLHLKFLFGHMFMFAMGTIGSRLRQALLRGCITLTRIGTIQWIVFALM